MGYVTTFGQKMLEDAAKKAAVGLFNNPAFIASALALSAGVSFVGAKALVQSDLVQIPAEAPVQVEVYEQPAPPVEFTMPEVVTTSSSETTTTTTTTTTTEATTTTTTTVPTTAPTEPGVDRFSKSYLIASADYPEVHVPGISLPAEYGDGLLDPEAAYYLINQIRVNNGLPELRRGGVSLGNAALTRLSEVMYNFSQTRPDGSSYNSVFSQLGIRCDHYMESIGYGQYTAEHIVHDWMNSGDSVNNILNTDCTVVYIVCEVDEMNVPVWTLEAVTLSE